MDTKKLLKFKLIFFIGLLIAFIPVLIYAPGLNGPFIFDDLPNIVHNEGIHMQKLSFSALNEAAHSLKSGPFGRPIAGLSFALNYYVAGGIENPFGFKLSNVIIHSANGLLVLWLVTLIFRRLQHHSAQPLKLFSRKHHIMALAGACTLMWVTHPILLTSVLYVVQRMTSMATTFMLLALICYLLGRNTLLQDKRKKGILLLLALPLFGVLALLCKETAVLLPLYVLALEVVLYAFTSPWCLWTSLSIQTRRAIMAGMGLAVIFILVLAFKYALPGYGFRDFTLMERVLTESRILLFYIWQIFIPSLSGFGLYHDDIAISHSLMEPWTTLPALLIIIGLLSYAFYVRNRYPLLTLGIFWFFISHILESSILPLELVHEHRNYLATLGIMFVLMQGLIWLYVLSKNTKIWLIVPVLVILFSFTTFARSNQWADLLTLLHAQTQQHPTSPRAWGDFSSAQIKNGNVKGALPSIEKAISLNPNEPGYYINLFLYTKAINLRPSEETNDKLLIAIRANSGSVMLSNMFHKIDGCLETTCKDMQTTLEKWLKIALESTESPRYKYYLGSNLSAQGKLADALIFLNQSIKEAPNHISPYLDKIEVFLKQGDIKQARITYTTLLNLNKDLHGASSIQVNNILQRINEAASSSTTR